MDDNIREEFEKMKQLIPVKGMSVEERTKRNKVVRENLPNLPNRTIFLLALIQEHQLSRNELIRRLDESLFENLRELVELADLLFSVRETKIIWKLIDKCFSEIERVSLLASQEEVIGIIRDFNLTRMGRDSYVFEDMICNRSDAQEILRQIEKRKIRNHLLMRYIEDKINTP